MTKKGAGKGRKARKKAEKQARKAQAPLLLDAPRNIPQPLPAPAPQSAPAFSGAGTLSLLETARTRWEHGEWPDLLALDGPALEADPERGKLALLLAAAQAQIGDMGQARSLARQAILWGCNRTLVARVLLSATQNSLARVAAALEEDPTPHFEAAIRLVQPQADAALLARTRRVRELARMGLLPAAAAALEQELGLARAEPGGLAERQHILESQVRILKHELVLAQKKNQLHAASDTPLRLDEHLKRLSVSQLGQDLWVLEKTGYKRGGFFVEFGATNGILLSNTYLLERQFDWNGICAEPNPDYFRELQSNRSCRVTDACIGAQTGQEVEFILADEFGTMAAYVDSDEHQPRRTAYAASGRTIRLTTTSLHDMLVAGNAPRDIDYLSIDTEGSEYDILSHFPFDKWCIRLLTVEHNFTPMRDKIFDLLTARGYRRTEAQWDDWYELSPA